MASCHFCSAFSSSIWHLASQPHLFVGVGKSFLHSLKFSVISRNFSKASIFVLLAVLASSSAVFFASLAVLASSSAVFFVFLAVPASSSAVSFVFLACLASSSAK